MTRPNAVALAFIAAVASGCGASSDAITSATDNTCSVTLGDAQSGTLRCTEVDGSYNSSSNSGGFTLTAVAAPQFVIVGISFVGVPATGTYTNTSRVDGTVSVSVGNALWEASAGNDITQGSFSLVLTSVTATGTTSANGNDYTVHGTLDATMPPASGSSATGGVTLHATF